MNATAAQRIITASIHSALDELDPDTALKVAEWIETEASDIVGKLREDAGEATHVPA